MNALQAMRLESDGSLLFVIIIIIVVYCCEIISNRYGLIVSTRAKLVGSFFYWRQELGSDMVLIAKD